jgi:HAD superfamily hydrolase (TIGR01459 family)
VSQLAAFGVGEAAFTAVVTSGDVTRALLKARSGRRVFAIGPERDAPLYQGLDLVFVDLETADFISCTGPVDDERETAEDYRAILERGQARGLEMICANPDRVVQRGERLIVCAGALADIYGDLGGRVLTAGKPHAPIYEEALRAAARGRPLLKSRVLAIGDGVQTDVQGANREGLDCLFIAGGIHAAATLEGGELSSRGLAAALAREGACARYALAALRW